MTYLRALAICFILLANLCSANSYVSAQTYSPLLDEYDGVKSNDGNYLILPAFENTDPSVKSHAYFIFPKFLQYAVDETDGSLNLGVNHIGFSLLPDGSPDYSPKAAIVANVVAVQDSATVAAIKDELTKRDVAAGLSPPNFPIPTFESYEIAVTAAGLASADKDTSETYNGGYPGQPFLVKVNLHSDADRAFVLATPSSAGRDAKLWGVAIRGKVKGYGNRLDCTIRMQNKQVYDYFAARASGQAYWGIVKADVSKEVRSMDQKKVVDFGPCKGDQSKIDALVMPVWQLILDMTNDDGEKMFYQMVKEVTTGTSHPGESSSGWGFQASARWASVSSTRAVEFNFNVSTPIYWTLPMSISFSSSCSAFKAYFVNGSNPAKPCVDAKDASAIAIAQRHCVVEFAKEINNLPFPKEQKEEMYKQLRYDGCGYNFSTTVSSPISLYKTVTISKYSPIISRIRQEARTESAKALGN
jgi:hypothetical protein